MKKVIGCVLSFVCFFALGGGLHSLAYAPTVKDAVVLDMIYPKIDAVILDQQGNLIDSTVARLYEVLSQLSQKHTAPRMTYLLGQMIRYVVGQHATTSRVNEYLTHYHDDFVELDYPIGLFPVNDVTISLSRSSFGDASRVYAFSIHPHVKNAGDLTTFLGLWPSSQLDTSLSSLTQKFIFDATVICDTESINGPNDMYHIYRFSYRSEICQERGNCQSVCSYMQDIAIKQSDSQTLVIVNTDQGLNLEPILNKAVIH